MIEIWHTLNDERFAEWWKKKFPAKLLPVLPRVANALCAAKSFEFSDEGDIVAVIPVYDIMGAMVDLCAWNPSQPDRTYLLTGAGRDLNIAAAVHAQAYRKPLHVAANPIEWLLAGGTGSCPVRGYEHLTGVQRIITDDETYRRIEADIRAMYPVPSRHVA